MPEQPSSGDETTTDASVSIGARLKAARERGNISISQVAEQTRIRATLVREIEDDNFTGCGGTFYARGHVRAIATTVDLDPTPLLAMFDATQQELPQAVRAPLPPYEPATAISKEKATVRSDIARANRSRPNWASAMVAVAALVAVLVVVSFAVSLGGGKGAQTATAVGNTTDALPSTSPSARAPAARVPAKGATKDPTNDATTSPSNDRVTDRPTDSTTGSSPAGVDLRLRVDDGASWVKVTDSGGDEVYQGVLRTGEAKEFSDDTSLTVRYGNAPAVTVVVNGETRGQPGCRHSVCTEKYQPAAAG